MLKYCLLFVLNRHWEEQKQQKQQKKDKKCICCNGYYVDKKGLVSHLRHCKEKKIISNAA